MTRIAIATSIPPRLVRHVDGREVGQEYQDRCVESWLRAGFRILSANFADEIPILAQRYPQVHFLSIERPKSGWKAPAIDDLLRALAAQEEDIAGIINADILLGSSDWLKPIESAVHGAIVAGRRLDIDSLDLQIHEAYPFGFDFFFFEREAIPDLTNRSFSIGKPWWDYYLPLVFRLRGLEIRLLVSPDAFHLKHPTAFDLPTWRFMATEFAASILEFPSNSPAPPPELVSVVKLSRKIVSGSKVYETVPPSLWVKVWGRILRSARNLPGRFLQMSKLDFGQDADRHRLSKACAEAISVSMVHSGSGSLASGGNPK
jgi:hypothetical protein